MAQFLLDDPNSIASTYMVAHTAAYDANSQETQYPLLVSLDTACRWHTSIEGSNTHTQKIKIINKN